MDVTDLRSNFWGACSPTRLTCTDSLALQHHSVENKANVLGGLRGAWTLFAQQVQDLCGKHSVLAVLDKLAQMGQARLFALRVLLDDADDAVHDGPLVLKSTLQGEKRFTKKYYYSDSLWCADSISIIKKQTTFSIQHVTRKLKKSNAKCRQYTVI